MAKGNPLPNNEEYFQASTNLPLIHINGNWAIFERRVNDIEANYLLAPDGHPQQTLTTIAGQANFILNSPSGAQFTSSDTVPTGKMGSIEIKASWRIPTGNAGDDPARYYTQNAFLAVSGDWVQNGRPFCSTVTLGLVGNAYHPTQSGQYADQQIAAAVDLGHLRACRQCSYGPGAVQRRQRLRHQLEHELD